MGLFTKDIETFEDLFLHQLQDVYYAENQITKALPKMVDKATDKRFAPRVRNASRRGRKLKSNGLKRSSTCLAKKPRRPRAPRSTASSRKRTKLQARSPDKAVLDAALIASAQAVEHYEITRYGTLVVWAKQIGRADIAAILKETLDEEYATDDKLTKMAESKLNAKAEAVTA